MTIFPEQMKPIPVRIRAGTAGQFAFWARRVVDLQLRTIWRFLSPILPTLEGKILDVGCGEMPFRFALSGKVHYTGIDVAVAEAFGMVGDGAIQLFDGRNSPLPDNHFDHVLCTEVLEHALDPITLMIEMRRVLKPGGSLIMTVPFSARVHHAPYDFHRFTSYRLAEMLSPFSRYDIAPRGNDIATIANKLIILSMALLQPRPSLLWRIFIAMLCAPMAAVFLVAAHISIACGTGSKNDPLGYAVRAFK